MCRDLTDFCVDCLTLTLYNTLTLTLSMIGDRVAAGYVENDNAVLSKQAW